jgi:hypothetical protein
VNFRFVCAQWGKLSMLLGTLLAAVGVLFLLIPGEQGVMLDAAELSLLGSGGGAAVAGLIAWMVCKRAAKPSPSRIA